MTNNKIKLISVLLFSLLVIAQFALADVIIENHLECQNKTKKIYDGGNIIGHTITEYLANITTYEAPNGTRTATLVRTDCSVYGNYTDPETSLDVGYCHAITNETAECRTRLETAPVCKLAGEFERVNFTYLGIEDVYDICYRDDQEIAYTINGYVGCANGNPMIDAAGCVKEGTINYANNTCAVESQAKTCSPTIGWTCDTNDVPAIVDCDDYVIVDNATDTIQNYQVSKSTCALNGLGIIGCSGSECCVQKTLICDNDTSDGFGVGYPAFVEGNLKFCLFNGTDYIISDKPTVDVGDGLLCTGEDIDHDGFIDNNATYCHSTGIYQACDFYVPNYVTSEHGDDNDVCVKGKVKDCFLGNGYKIGCDTNPTDVYACLDNICVDNSAGLINGVPSDIHIIFENMTTIENLDVDFGNITDINTQQQLTFKDLRRHIIETQIDLDKNHLDFDAISLGTQNCSDGFGWTIVNGLPPLPSGSTKSVFVDSVNNSNRLCVRDAPTTTLAEISAGCNGVGEIYFDSCSSAGQTIINTGNEYTCQRVVNDNGFVQYKVTGLHHSGAVELLGALDPTGTNVPEFNGNSLLLGLLLVTIGILVIRRKD